MAGIPENTSYNEPTFKAPTFSPGGRFSFVQNGVAKSLQENAAKGLLGATPQTNAEAPGTQKYEPLPQNYGTFVTPNPAITTNKGLTTPSSDANASLRNINIPGLVAGQYVFNKEAPGTVVRTQRPENTSTQYAERQLLLGGKPSDLYEVDHVIPLWAGGADTLANKQVLPYQEHALKTRAQAVPLTLLAYGKINQTQARSMALRWKALDTTDIPDVNDTGLIDVKDAEAIAKRWEDQARTYKPNLTFKDYLNTIPEATKSLGDNLFGAKTPAVLRPVEEFVKGAATGLSAGWIPYEIDSDAKWWDGVAGGAGMIAGTFVPIGLIAKGLGATAKGFSALRGVSQAAAKSQGLLKNVPQAVTTLNRAKAFSKLHNIDFGNLAKLGAANVLYGQMSPEGLAGNMVDDERAKATTRFFEDLGYGVLAGVASPSLKGMATVGAGAGIISIMADPEHPADALVNAGVAAGLHGAFSYPANKAAAKAAAAQIEAYNAKLDDEATRAANNILNTYLGDSKLKKLSTGDAVPAPGTHSFDEVMNMKAEALDNLDRLALTGKPSEGKPALGVEWDLQDYIRERARIIASARQLYKRGLPLADRQKADLDDLLSFANRGKNRPGPDQANMGVPGILDTAAKRLGAQYRLKSLASHNSDPQSGAFPVGLGRVSGMGSTVNNNIDNTKLFFQYQANGQASPTLFIVDQPETAPLWRRANDLMSPEDVKAGNVKPSEHPENAAQVFGMVWDKNGNHSYISLGWLPRHFKNFDSPTAFNKSEWVVNGQVPPVDRAMNKDDIVTMMRKQKTPVLLANVYRGSSEAVHSKEPYMVFTLNDENWNASRQLGRALENDSSQTTTAALMAQARQSLDAKSKSTQAQAAITRIQKPADVVVEELHLPAGTNTEEAKPTQEAVKDILARARAAIGENKTPREIQNGFKNDLQTEITPEEAIQFSQKGGRTTAREVFDSLANAAKDDRTSPGVTEVLRSHVKPFLESPAVRNSSEGAILPSVRVSGGITAPKGTLEVPPTTQATMTPVNAEEAKIVQSAVEQAKTEASGQMELPLAEKISQVASQTPKTASGAFKISQSYQVPPQAKQTPPGAKMTPKQPSGVGVSAPQADAITRLQRASYGGSPEQRQSIVQDTVKATTRAYDESRKDMMDRGAAMLEYAPVTKDRRSYAQTLAGIIRSIRPGGKIADARSLEGARTFTPEETASIGNPVKTRLRLMAEELVDGAFSKDNEIAFITQLPSDPQTLSVYRALLRADTLSALGDMDNARIIMQNLDHDTAVSAARLLKLGDIGVDGKGTGVLRLLDARQEIPSAAKGNYTPKKGRSDFEFLEKDKWKNIDRQNAVAGKQVVEQVAAGAHDAPDSYSRGYSEALDAGLKKLFGENYAENNKALSFIGRALDDAQGYGKYRWDKLYQTVKTDKDFKEYTDSHNYLVAFGKRDKAAMEQARKTRNQQLADTENETFGEAGNALPEDITADIREGRLRVHSKRQSDTAEDKMVIGLTPADKALYAGINSALLEGVEPTMLHGVNDARLLLQKIMGWHNQIVKKRNTALGKYPSLQETMSFISDIKPTRGQDTQKYYAAVEQDTDAFFAKIIEKLNAETSGK